MSPQLMLRCYGDGRTTSSKFIFVAVKNKQNVEQLTQNKSLDEHIVNTHDKFDLNVFSNV